MAEVKDLKIIYNDVYMATAKIKVNINLKTPISWNTILSRAGRFGLKTGLYSSEISTLWRTRPTTWREVDAFLLGKKQLIQDAVDAGINREVASMEFDIWYEETGSILTIRDLLPRSIPDDNEIERVRRFFTGMQEGDRRNFQIYDFETGQYTTSLTGLDILDIILEVIDPNGKYLVEINGARYLAINARNIADWQAAVTAMLTGTSIYGSSFMDAVAQVNAMTSINLYRVSKYGHLPGQRNEDNASFFPYWNNSNIDLEKQQILKPDSKNLKILKDSCFIYSLEMSGLFSKTELESIRIYCRTRSLSGKKIGEVSTKFGFTIVQTRRDKRGKIDIHVYNEGQPRVVNIGKLEGHFFLNNHNEFRTIENLLNEGKFEPMSIKDRIKYTSEYYKERDEEIDCLTMMEPFLDKKGEMVYRDYRPVIKETKVKNPEDKGVFIWCADFEAYYHKIVDDNYSYAQLPLLLVAEGLGMKINGEIQLFNRRFEQQMPKPEHIKEWFNMMTRYGDAVVYFHNLGYDITQLLSILPSNAKIVRYLPAGTSVFSLEIKWFSKTITFRCSYKLTAQSISALAESYLKSEIKKEMCPYELYNDDTIGKEWIDLDLVRDYFKERFPQFQESAKDFIDQEKFYLHRFNLFYCKRDVEILRKSLMLFHQMVKEHFELDAFEYLTAPSLADAYLRSKGCYEGVMEFSGIPLLFMQKAVVGGRCMTNSNKTWYVEGEIGDEDCNSLYPTAMSRTGFPMGVPVTWNDPSYTYEELQDIAKYYIVEIDIKDIAIKRDFPLISDKNEEGIRMFSNDVRGKIVIDKYALEDAIRFQNIKFEIIRGYYWTEMNYTINAVIIDLFNKRLVFKKAGNPVQEVIKLIMNSAYGKTIEKPHEKSSRIIEESELPMVVNNNLENIAMIVSIGKTGKMLVNEYSKTLNHYNRVPCGVAILSMSKRVMNEVMCLGEDLGLTMFYQDTDSIHIKRQDWSVLSKKYEEIYDRKLAGKGLGQFSTDYEGDLCGAEAYYIGKKLYGVKFNKEFTDKKGHKHTHHLRAKGIPNGLMKWEDYQALGEGVDVMKNLLEATPGIRTTHLQARIIKTFARIIHGKKI